MWPDIEIISAPSILGLSSTGVDKLPETFLRCGLKEKLGTPYQVTHVPTLNAYRTTIRDAETNCLNTKAVIHFSKNLKEVIVAMVDKNRFAFVLGGDCSILLGIMPALKAKGNYGLIFIDAHADFYAPEKSVTGEIADMDLAIVTGRGPEALTNIDGLKPYVQSSNVIHIGQRDEIQAADYGSEDIRETNISCFSLESIRLNGITKIAEKILKHMDNLEVLAFWIHFDTDVLADDINPAVDYRLPGGLQFDETTLLLRKLLSTKKISGISVTIYNSYLDQDSRVAKGIVNCLTNAFDLRK